MPTNCRGLPRDGEWVVMSILELDFYILKASLQSKQSALKDPGINNLTQALLDWKIVLEYLPRHLN